MKFNTTQAPPIPACVVSVATGTTGLRYDEGYIWNSRLPPTIPNNTDQVELNKEPTS